MIRELESEGMDVSSPSLLRHFAKEGEQLEHALCERASELHQFQQAAYLLGWRVLG